MARAFVAAFADGDPDRIVAFVSDDFVNRHTSELGESGQGRAAYRERLPAFLTRFSELRYDVEDVVADGERVVVAYTMRAVFEGAPIDIPGVFRLRVRDGLISERTDYFDSLTFLRQTGQV